MIKENSKLKSVLKYYYRNIPIFSTCSKFECQVALMKYKEIKMKNR